MQPSLWSVLRRRWQDSRSRKNLTATTQEIFADFWEFVLDSMPQRRRARYGDIEYDWEHRGANTTAATQSTRTRLLAAIAGASYQPTEPFIFAEMLGALRISNEDFTFIDIGSGKGRILLMAAEHGFRRVIGIELVPELHDIAAQNLAALGSDNVESICIDARDYHFPPDPLVLYLFNPLPAEALSQVLDRLCDSWRDHPREIKVIYHNPLSEHVLATRKFLRKCISTDQYVIYST